MKSATILLIFFFALSTNVSSQEKNKAHKGSIVGTVKDSLHNYVLSAATVSIYNVNDSIRLLSYTLTSNSGNFVISNLPLNIELKVVVSYMGYSTFLKVFTLLDSKEQNDIGVINLLQQIYDIGEVVVTTTPPVRINGDTLEFNASAFQLDKNAVADDLLRKLPGVVVWGDGAITVNGKQINQLFVEGKPFFNGANGAAIKNIPKSAINKIQVYSSLIDPNNPLDSITTINIKLKNNAKTGHFGKISAGYGTNNRYQIDANVNLFSPKDQIGIVGVDNNVNKKVNDANTLIANSAFKGVSARVDYQPDFTVPGIYKQRATGLVWQHDFIERPDAYLTERLDGDLLVTDAKKKIEQNTETITSIGNDSVLSQKNLLKNSSAGSNYNVRSSYIKHKNENLLLLSAFGNSQNVSEQIESNCDIYLGTSANNKVSTNTVQTYNNVNARSVNLQSDFLHCGPTSGSSQGLNNYRFSYNISMASNGSNGNMNSNFVSMLSSAQNTSLDRNFDKSSSYIDQVLSVNIGNFTPWLFRRNKRLNSYHIYAYSTIKMFSQQDKNEIADLNTSNNAYDQNSYLSNTTKYNVVDETSGLTIGKNITRLLANRFQKTLEVGVDLNHQIYFQRNQSSHDFQNINKHYENFVPSFHVKYDDLRFSDYQNRYEFSFVSRREYPTYNQLAILSDSSNIYNVRVANPFLHEASFKDFNLKFRHDEVAAKNLFNYGSEVSFSSSDSFFADSLVVDQAGRYFYHSINLTGFRRLSSNVFINKSLKVGDNLIQLRFRTALQLSKVPGYVKYLSAGNSNLLSSNTLRILDTVSIDYAFRNFIALNIKGGFFLYNSKQHSSDGSMNQFGSSIIFTSFGAGINITKNMTLNSNLSFNRSSATASESVNYTIWNADFAYKLMKGNNLEMRFSALDILHQNNGIINIADKNYLTHGTTNVLQQYYMFTISYFPRKFGKK